MKLQKVNILLPIAYAYREQIVEVAKVDSNFSVVDNCIKQSIYIPHRFFSGDLKGQNLSPLDGVTVTIGINLEHIHVMGVRPFSKVEPLLKSLGVDLSLLPLSEFAESANSDYRNTLTRYLDEQRHISYTNEGSICYKAEGFSEYDTCDNCRVWYGKYSPEAEPKELDYVAKSFFKKFKSCTKVMFWREITFKEIDEELFPKRVPDVIIYRNI